MAPPARPHWRGAAVKRGMSREEPREMGLHADGAYAGATAAVGNAKGFVEVDVSDIRALKSPGRHSPTMAFIFVGAIEHT